VDRSVNEVGRAPRLPLAGDDDRNGDGSSGMPSLAVYGTMYHVDDEAAGALTGRPSRLSPLVS